MSIKVRLPFLKIALISWLLLLLGIIFIPPASAMIISFFFVFLFFACYLTLISISQNRRRVLILSLLPTVLLGLRLFSLLNLFSLLIILALILILLLDTR